MGFTKTIGCLGVVAMMAPTGQALAADLGASQDEAMMAAVSQKSPWQVRVRALGVITDDNGNVDGIAGSDLSYSDTVIPELDITYYFTENIAAELILGTTWADVKAEGSISGLGTVAEAWLLPPTLTLQYHFTNFGQFKPYVGAGVNYTIFYNQDGKNAMSDLDIENTWGAALQVGFDYMIDESWGVNLDVKKLFLEPDYDITMNDGTKLSGKAELNPWLVGAGITYRF